MGKTLYDYRDEDGQLLFQVIRQEPGRNGEKKSIYQRQPVGKRGWLNSLKGVRLVLYRLPEILKQSPERFVFVAEGEKCVDALWNIDVAATTNPQGAGKWKAEYSEHLRGRHVIILADNDANGCKHADAVARSLNGIAASVRGVDLPGLPPKGDIVDWLAAGGDKDTLLKLVEAAPPLKAAAPADSPLSSRSADDKPDKPERKSAATRLVELAVEAGAELFHTTEHAAFASIRVDTHLETLALRGAAFKRWLGRLLHTAEGRAPGGQAVQDALAVLEGKAHYEGEERAVHVRLAEYGDKIYLDLADKDWRVLEIDAGGWRIAENPPVRFRRPKGLLPLPLPDRGGRLDELRQLVNVADDADWRLLIVWTIAALWPRGPYPILCLYGQQGSAKSTAGKMVRLLIDPSVAPLRSEPKEPRDLMIAASNGWVLCYDNLSSISSWLSDGFCCLATGSGFSTRELYANDEEMIFSAMRPVILTSIEDVATRGDLLDRAVLLSLPPIPDDRRVQERVLWHKFKIARPRILGAILDAVTGAMRELPDVQLASLPRMADFAELGVAVEKALAWPDGSFLDAYAGNRNDANEVALESSPLVPHLRRFLKAKGQWTGTASDLLAELVRLAGETEAKKRDWPGNAKALGGRLKRLAPNLRAIGVEVEFHRDNRQRLITLKANGRDFASLTSPSSLERENPANSGDANGDVMGSGDANGDVMGDVVTQTVTHRDARKPRKNKRNDVGDVGDAKSPSLSYLAPGLTEGDVYTPFDDRNGTGAPPGEGAAETRSRPRRRGPDPAQGDIFHERHNR